MIQQGVPRPPALVVSRASVVFLLRSVRAITRHVDGDVLGGITVLALLQGMYAQVALRSAGSPRPARPVSVQSLARSLRTPPETMRRCVARLIALGWCERVSTKGVVIAQNPAAQAKIDLLLAEIRAAFFSMLVALRRIDFDFDVMGQAAAAEKEPDDLTVVPDEAACATSPAAEYNLAIDRVVLDFGLRIFDGTAPALGHDYPVACVFAAILSANATPFSFDSDDAWRYGTRDSLAPDEIRRPVPLAEISQVLGIPYETVRRYVNTLIACGDVVRDERKGLLVPASLLLSPRLITTSMEITRRFVEMVGDLKRIGFDFQSLDA